MPDVSKRITRYFERITQTAMSFALAHYAGQVHIAVELSHVWLVASSQFQILDRDTFIKVK